MPVPLSPKSGLGIRVTVLPCLRATFLMMYLYHIKLSAILVRLLNCMSISAWPPVATSWCCASTAIPTCSMTRTISERMSFMLSVGGTGK